MTDNIKGKRILIDPIGGLYNDDSTRAWRYQKNQITGVYGDIATFDIAVAAFDILKIVGADVFATRCMRHSRSEIGWSRQPLFHEGAEQYLHYCKMRPSMREDKSSEFPPARIWSDGATSLERDGNARVNFAKYISADAVIAIDVMRQTKDGLEVRHNQAPGAKVMAENVLWEVSRRMRKMPTGVVPLGKEDATYAKTTVPTVILSVGSASDPKVTRFLFDRMPWYRNMVGLGLFAGIWRSYSGPSSRHRMVDHVDEAPEPREQSASPATQNGGR